MASLRKRPNHWQPCMNQERCEIFHKLTLRRVEDFNDDFGLLLVSRWNNLQNPSTCNEVTGTIIVVPFFTQSQWPVVWILRHSVFLPHAVNCGRFVLSADRDFFDCIWNISGTAERICIKFTMKTCLVPLSEEFECQGQRSRSSGTNCNGLAANNVT